MGCKMVHTDAENYEGIYFLTDEEVLDAAARYRRWWGRQEISAYHVDYRPLLRRSRFAEAAICGGEIRYKV